MFLVHFLSNFGLKIIYIYDSTGLFYGYDLNNSERLEYFSTFAESTEALGKFKNYDLSTN